MARKALGVKNRRRIQNRAFRLRLWKRHPFCVYCRCHLPDFLQTSLDHAMPKSRGGSNRWSNLVLACMTCNSTKSDMTAEEFMGWMESHQTG